jgi:hypothetical protein
MLVMPTSSTARIADTWLQAWMNFMSVTGIELSNGWEEWFGCRFVQYFEYVEELCMSVTEYTWD